MLILWVAVQHCHDLNIAVVSFEMQVSKQQWKNAERGAGGDDLGKYSVDFCARLQINAAYNSVKSIDLHQLHSNFQ
jgi:hypothetical protein